jgi:hypothetical protein
MKHAIPFLILIALLGCGEQPSDVQQPVANVPEVEHIRLDSFSYMEIHTKGSHTYAYRNGTPSPREWDSTMTCQLDGADTIFVFRSDSVTASRFYWQYEVEKYSRNDWTEIWKDRSSQVDFSIDSVGSVLGFRLKNYTYDKEHSRGLYLESETELELETTSLQLTRRSRDTLVFEQPLNEVPMVKHSHHYNAFNMHKWRSFKSTSAASVLRVMLIR